MRIRSIRPEFWSSEDVAAMSWDTRLVFIGLWSYVDDNGVGRDLERLITTALFPLDGDLPESSRRVTGALRHLSDHGQITRYVVDGKAYLHISSWSKHQRIEKASLGRYPLPTCDNVEFPEPSPTTTGALPDPSTPGEGEKGRRGEVNTSAPDKPTRHVYPDDFLLFWEQYPKKVSKDSALKQWKLALKRATAEDIILGAKRYRENPTRSQQFTKDPDGWLSAGKWADETEVVAPRVDPYAKMRLLG
jgi:hypothetical protein